MNKFVGLISVCCSCEKVKVEGSWEIRPDLLKKYKRNLSHGLCPHCIKELYPEFYEKMRIEEPALIA